MKLARGNRLMTDNEVSAGQVKTQVMMREREMLAQRLQMSSLESAGGKKNMEIGLVLYWL